MDLVFTGFINLPLDARSKVIHVELSVVPSLDGLYIHPHLLHLTVFGESQKKASYKTPLKSPSDWRMNFTVEYGSKVYHIPNYGNQKKVQLPDNCLENKDGNIRLLLGNNKLLINIISSLQGNSKKDDSDPDGNAITNIDVIERRIEEESWQYPEIQNQGKDYSKKLASKYTSKDFKVELHRCRLRVCVFDDVTKQLTDRAVSDVISNARDKNVGYLDLRSISDPGCCCSKGGWRFFLISEHKLARDKAATKQETEDEIDRSPPVVPVLVLADNANNIVEDSNGLLPLIQIPTDPDSFEVHGDAFSIIIPSQNPYVLNMMQQQGLHCRIFLYRCLDKTYSKSSVKFVYYSHEAFEDNCPFCFIKKVSQSSLEFAFSIGAGSGKRSRKRAKTSSGNAQSPADSSMTMSPYCESTSSGISSPGSASSPEHTPGHFTDNLSYRMSNQNTLEVFSYNSNNNSNSNSSINTVNYNQDYMSEIHGPMDVTNEPGEIDGAWLQDHDIGALIFDLTNDDLNTVGNLPIPDSCQDLGKVETILLKQAKESKDKEDKHIDEHIEKKNEEKTDAQTEKKEKEKLVELENKLESLSIKKEITSEEEFIKGEEKIKQAFQKMRLAENQTRSNLELTTTIKTDFQLEILAIAFAVLLYYFGGYFWN